MNKVELIGRISTEIDVKTSQAGKSFLNFNIAVNRKYKGSDGNYPTDFLTCKAFGTTVDFIGQYFTKGAKIAICGSVQTDEYQDNSGNKRKTTYILAEEVEFVEGKKETKAAPAQPQVQGATPKVQASLDFFGSMADSAKVTDLGSLPFEL